MKYVFTLTLLCSSLFAIAQQPNLTLKNRTHITSTCTLVAGEYTFDAAASLDSSIVVIEGDNLVVDFNEVLLHSSMDNSQPDAFKGVAIFIRNSRNVIIRNAHVHGYKVALRAENVTHLTLENCDFSYNYRQHLHSTPEYENPSDWMSFHHNEHDEWLRYGAAIYLDQCNDATVRHCTATNGQCGLLLTACNNGTFSDNNFSFNSGLGIGMYRCSGNEIFSNRLDFNIRGFSFGKYHRGQDAAGILLFEQCNNNLIAYNSATHCGDGLFLWAGQTTMDSGKGGSNDNVIFGNDFSDASNNGVEATFSRNTIVNNNIGRCDYGVWAGYSYHTIIGANSFSENNCAIAIEHGQNNHLLYNTFDKDSLAIKLWANKQQPRNWGYLKTRDTHSYGYSIIGNRYISVGKVYDFTRTDSIEIHSEQWDDTKLIYHPDLESRMVNFGKADTPSQDAISRFIAAFTPDIKGTVPDASPLAGKQNILVTEWGPYDFKSPMIHADYSRADDGKMFFIIAGPAGRWRLKDNQGIKLSRTSGKVPDTLSARVLNNGDGFIRIVLHYEGGTVIDAFGNETNAGKPYVFAYEKSELPIHWHLSFYKSDTFNAAKYRGVFSNALKRGFIGSDTVNNLNFQWWGAPVRRAPEDHFVVVAAGVKKFPEGNYVISLTADDGARLYLDGKLLIDAWDNLHQHTDDEMYHETTLHLEGSHQLRVEYFDYTGFATLIVSCKKKD